MSLAGGAGGVERSRIDALPTPLLARAATPYIALSSAANVVLQLSWPQVGHGVADSRVEGARLFDDPRRRRRTTAGFLAVAVHGSASERAAYRRAVNGSHAQVRSLPGETPTYTAFDPELQRWVGACLLHAFEESHVAVHGPLDADAEQFHREGVIFGALLQMPASLWPADRAAHADYWRAGLAAVSIDDEVRAYLTRVIRMEYLGDRVPERLSRWRTWLTTGFLPPQVRDQMHLPWTASDQRRFDRFTRRVAAVVRRSPPVVQGFPLDREIRDVRRRLAAGADLF